jgi:hypothetical protein
VPGRNATGGSSVGPWNSTDDSHNEVANRAESLPRYPKEPLKRGVFSWDDVGLDWILSRDFVPKPSVMLPGYAEASAVREAFWQIAERRSRAARLRAAERPPADDRMR